MANSMKKIKYYYNTNTLRYEKLETPLHVKLLRVLGFISAAIVTAIIIVSIAYKYFPSANEKRLMQYNQTLQERYLVLDEKTKKMQSQMKELEEQLKNLPPEQRKQIEAMMKQAQGAQRPQPTLKAEDCAPDKVEIKRTGKSATVAGFAATGYQLFENGKLDAEVWIAPAITAAREIDPQKLERLMKEMLKALPQCPPRGQMMGADPVWKLMKDGYPVRSVEQDGGAVTEVVKAESRALAATEFQAPAGFARKPLSELMGGK